MIECYFCGHKSSSEWNYCVKCGNPRSADSPLAYKLVIMGSGGVGKSAISTRFIHGDFVSIYDPTIEECYSKHVNHNGDDVKIDLLDTAGQDTFSAMKELYTLCGDGFAFVYSIDQRRSFDRLKDFYALLQRRRIGNSPPLILVGNKSDLIASREISTRELMIRAEVWEADHIEVSAKTGENTSDIFFILLDRLRQQDKPVSKKRRGCVLL